LRLRIDTAITFPLAGGQGPSNAPIERLGNSVGFPAEWHYLTIGRKTVNYYFLSNLLLAMAGHFLFLTHRFSDKKARHNRA